MAEKKNEKELNDFQLRNIKILTHLLENDAISDDIVEHLRKSELDYFSLIDKYELLEHKVNIDEKTNLLKYKNDYLTNIIKTASRIYFGTEQSRYYISFIRFDIDDFSQFNNKYGHDLGDKVLILIADIIRENSRPTDYAIRFGGEEFDVILPSTDLKGTKKYIDVIFEAIRKLELNHNNETIKVTVSAGISTLEYYFENNKKIVDSEIEKYFKQLQKEADDALYEAKYLGKNRYCIYSKKKEKEYIEIRQKYAKK